MNAEVQAYIDKWAEKTAAKADALVALGAAKQAEWNAEQALTDSDRKKYEQEAAAHWDVVARRGMKGDEGRLYAEAFALAEAYVAAHPEQFASFEQYVNPDDHDLLVTLASAMSTAGRKEEQIKLTMFELVRFERKNVTQAMQAVVRKPGQKSEA